MLANNEIKDIKLIRSLEIRGILLKGATKKITTQEGGFLNFLRPLISADLSLIKNILRLTAAASTKDTCVQKSNI